MLYCGYIGQQDRNNYTSGLNRHPVISLSAICTGPIVLFREERESRERLKVSPFSPHRCCNRADCQLGVSQPSRPALGAVAGEEGCVMMHGNVQHDDVFARDASVCLNIGSNRRK